MTNDTLKYLLRVLALIASLTVLGCADDDDPTGPDPGDTDDPLALASSYAIVDTDQSLCFDNSEAIACPTAGADFHGQDSQHDGHQPGYTVSDDGLTVVDQVTGLVWQRMPDTDLDGALDVADKLTWAEAQAQPDVLNAAGYGGYDDWRLPTIKELYSLILFTGTDPAPDGSGTAGLTPFLDAAFVFMYGDESAGERIIDSQYASSTLYVAGDLLFGVNFADGRIKGYGLTMPGGGGDKTFFVQCVRGNVDYGRNVYVDNGDGTITDEATQLMWSQTDSGELMNWQAALAYAEAQNAAGYLGHGDWRVPSVKELQSLVDYTRSPDTTDSPAIDPLFGCTAITNERGETDWGFYWSSTTHMRADGTGASGSYVAFGRSLGYMNGSWVDVHGAGSQRSDPKDGDPAEYPEGFGPQGDAIRILNPVRLVRDI